MNLFFGFVFVTIFLISCSPKIGSSITAKQPPLSDTTFVLVLQQEDDFTNDGIEIGTIKSVDNGLSTNCTYYEVIDKLKQLAKQNGANVIKITERIGPHRNETCEKIRAKIYKVPNFRTHEKEIEWSASRKLVWEDFKGNPKPITNPNVAAQTYCGFSFQTNYISVYTKAKIFTRNTFTCDLSWVLADRKNQPGLLQHEQSHFDLCEVYARKLRQKLEEKKLTVFNINTDANIIFKTVAAQYLDRQEMYDKETAHGLNQQKQKEWTTEIAKELAALNNYSR